jgi:hypothetical protein
MKRKRVAITTFVLCVLLSTPTQVQAAAKRCPSYSHPSNIDADNWGISNIRVAGTTCSIATKAVVAAVLTQDQQDILPGAFFNAGGFRWVYTTEEAGASGGSYLYVGVSKHKKITANYVN